MKPWGLVFFDVDSTLAAIEGIDRLGADDPEIARLTEAAMNGELPVEDVYARRLDVIRPTRDAVDALSREYVAAVVPGAAEVITSLRNRGIAVHLVTGGLAPAVLPLARFLGIRTGAVHAVGIRFGDDGRYLDFDRTSPLARSGGKERVIRDIRIREKGRAALVGDGVTDLEAKRAVDLFIGFGGVVARDAVREGADRFVEERSLLPVLEILEESSK